MHRYELPQTGCEAVSDTIDHTPFVPSADLMKRYKAMWHDSWILWSLIAAAGLVLPFLNRLLFGIWLFNLPICIGVFVYFAYVRYDEDGHPRGG